eukprot:scaffold119996_cov43-Attheya_sp.AAC.1
MDRVADDRELSLSLHGTVGSAALLRTISVYPRFLLLHLELLHLNEYHGFCGICHQCGTQSRPERGQADRPSVCPSVRSYVLDLWVRLQTMDEIVILNPDMPGSWGSQAIHA